jgi:O-antigen/teichoic acid export membrane protein
MSSTQIFARSLRANWIGVAANGIVSLFLSRYVYAALGEDIYGVWLLVVSLTGYLSLIELGMRTSLGRFINYYLGRKETEHVNGIISTALTFFLACGIPLFAAAILIAPNFGAIFPKASPAYLDGARSAVMMVSLSLWLTFFGATFTQVLFSQDRFDIYNIINIIVLVVRAVGTVVVLHFDGGIARLSAVQAGSSLVGVILSYIMAHRVFPALNIRFRRVTWAYFRELSSFSIWAFVSSIAMRLLYLTDLLVIGWFLGPGAVPYYNIPIMLVVYSREFVGQITEVLAPQTMKHCGTGDYESLRYMFRWGSKVTMALAIPFYSGLILLGPEFMTMFWGPAFDQSKWVLVILAVPQLVTMAVRVGGSIISGLGHVRFGASMSLAQALCNFGLTLLFLGVFKMGLIGVALGTFIPMILFNIFIGLCIARWIQLPVMPFIRRNVLRWTVGVGVLFSLIYIKRQVSMQGLLDWTDWLRDPWIRFFIKVIVFAGTASAINWFIVFNAKDRRQIWLQIKAMFQRRKPILPSDHPEARL